MNIVDQQRVLKVRVETAAFQKEVRAAERCQRPNRQADGQRDRQQVHPAEPELPGQIQRRENGDEEEERDIEAVKDTHSAAPPARALRRLYRAYRRGKTSAYSGWGTRIIAAKSSSAGCGP